jgi:DNA primase
LTVPIEPSLTHDERNYAEVFAKRPAAADSAHYTLASATDAARQFLSIICAIGGATRPWVPTCRACDGFRVAAPVSWNQVNKGLRADGVNTKKPPLG